MKASVWMDRKEMQKTLPTIEESSSLKQQLEFRMYTRAQTWNEILVITTIMHYYLQSRYWSIRRYNTLIYVGHARACAFMQRIQMHWPVSWYWDNIVSWKPQLLDLSHTQTPTLTLTLALHVAYFLLNNKHFIPSIKL